MHKFNMDTMTRHYLICAMWADLMDEGGEPLDNTYSLDDIAPESLEEAHSICFDFYESNKELISQWCELLGYDEEQVGHDLWLTSQGHGAGFWDRANYYSQPEAYAIGQKLSEASKGYSISCIYVGDNGQIYLM